MSGLIDPPSSGKFRLSLSEADINSQLGNHRLLSVKSYLLGKKRVYSAVSVKDTGPGAPMDGEFYS